jgi:uncharacterized protein (DUF1810 family)
MFEHFVEAQDRVYAAVTAELSAGRKESHWMWYVFPQLRGLGSSPRSVRYGLAGLAEAQAYLADAVLGPRLRECTALVLGHSELSAHAIFDTPDDLKFRSSMTLFAEAAGTPEEAAPFRKALETFYGGRPDPATLALLGEV